MKNFIRPLVLCSAVFCVVTGQAQLAITVSPLKVVGQKAVVPLILKNSFSERVESARAVVFLLDEQGKMVGQSTRWVIGGSMQTATNQPSGLAAGATNNFHFVVNADKPIATTNLTAKVQFTRIVMEGGKLGDATKDVIITSASK